MHKDEPRSVLKEKTNTAPNTIQKKPTKIKEDINTTLNPNPNSNLNDLGEGESSQCKYNEEGSEREEILKYMKDVFKRTDDFKFKYDLNKCINIFEGNEDPEIEDYRNELESVVLENEELIRKNDLLVVENEHLKSKIEESNSE